MLYDPKWEKPSLAGLIEWLRRQPADGTYDWMTCQNCVIGRYLTAMTGEHEGWTEHIRTIGSEEDYKYIGAGSIHGGCHTEWTYGQALERALIVQREREQAALV